MNAIINGVRISHKKKSDMHVHAVAVMPDGERVPCCTKEELMFLRRFAHGWETVSGNPCTENKVNNLLRRHFGMYV